MGDMPLASKGNLAAKGLVAQMVAEKRAPKTIKNVIQVVKMVVASAINDEGDQIYLRKWNHEFIDLPEVTDQHTPTFSAEEVQQIVSSAKGQYQMLYALLAGTGMRIGEVSGLEIDKCRASYCSTQCPSRISTISTAVCRQVARMLAGLQTYISHIVSVF